MKIKTFLHLTFCLIAASAGLFLIGKQVYIIASGQPILESYPEWLLHFAVIALGLAILLLNTQTFLESLARGLEDQIAKLRAEIDEMESQKERPDR